VIRWTLRVAKAEVAFWVGRVGYRLRPYDDRLDARRWWFERPGACSRSPHPRRRWLP
jgi:hypothetical protein